MPQWYLFIRLLFLAWMAGHPEGGETRILDLEHMSSVFGETRHYRIFLPPGYESNLAVRYPVIYFFHGWGERFNQGTREGAGAYDQGQDYQGDNIAAFVKKNDVIVVKWDGYNPRTTGEKYPRPYNVGPVETYRQFPLYFPELVRYIDAQYRTIPDRDHRALSGLSMGGFMAFWIGGKYPHLVGSVSNFMGSAEFMVGPRAFPSEYLHTDMYRNYEGVRTRLVMGTKDFIRWYHAQMNRIWDFVRPDYEHETFDWDHGTPGMAKQLGFHMNAFANPLPVPPIWHHIDVYPIFDVWGYSITSDRHRSGFTVLENVSRSGFRSSVREWLPNGQAMPSVKMEISTDAMYKPRSQYRITDVNLQTYSIRRETQSADVHGRLHIHLDGDLHEVGIVDTQSPVLSLAQFNIEGSDWPIAGREIDMGVHILNKGTGSSGDISLNLKSPNSGVRISVARARIAKLAAGEIRAATPAFRFMVEDRERAMVKFDLQLKDSVNRTWTIPFEVKLFADVKDFDSFEIADGRRLRFQKNGNQIGEETLGFGNGDGEVNPGESIIVLARDGGELRLTSLFSSDACVNPSGVNLRFSDYWGDYDHVGGSAKYSMPTISASCPPGHEIAFFAEYLIPHAPEHILRQGIVRVRVKGKDLTGPRARSAELSPGNILEVGVVEGGIVKAATAMIVRIDDPTFAVSAELNDDGLRGDRAAGDYIFSGVVPELPPGDYLVTIDMTDSAGNAGSDHFQVRVDGKP